MHFPLFRFVLIWHRNDFDVKSFSVISPIFRGYSSIFEKFLYQETDGIIFDIKNGEVILAMIYQGYEPIKVKGSKEVFFKVTRRELSKIQMYIELASSRN